MLIPISFLSTFVMPVNFSGPIAIGIIVIYGLFQGVKWLVSVLKKTPEQGDSKQKQIDENRQRAMDLQKIFRDLKEQQSIFMAHYQSEERVRANMERRIENIEQRLFSGNGRDSLETQVALLKQKVEQLENAKFTTARTTKKV